MRDVDIARTAEPGLSREEFLRRFKAYMVAHAGFDHFLEEDGTPAGTVAEYADQAGPSYWEDEGLRGEGPEECAAADMSYWGE